jgi:uncharacterized membrane protein YhhN
MTTPITVFSVLTAVSAALTIAAKLRENKRQEYLFKPLTMAFIILIALLGEDPVSTRYQILVLLGLLASLAGDVALMLPDPRHFMQGLGSFLIAHLCYIAAFTLESDGVTPLWYIVPFLVYGALMLRWLWPSLGSLRAPVLLYVAVILIMAWQAANRWLETRESAALLAMVGAYLFVMSDSALAVERFRGSWRSAPFWVLSAYFAAQWFIALSI